MRIGVSGHQRLRNRDSWKWIEFTIGEVLKVRGPAIIGITSLAEGTDQLFARLVLDLHGVLHVVLPFAGYERTFKNKSGLRCYRRLVELAQTVELLPPQNNDEISFFAAGIRVVDLSDLLIAVWDGQAAKGLGGTGDIVRHARSVGRRVLHLNPMTQTSSDM
jgi:hypothetical protein